MEIKDYIKPEFLVLLPVLYLIGVGIKKSEFKDKWIPLILGATGCVFCTIYCLATVLLTDYQSVLMVVFTSFTQGILAAGGSVYIHQILKQSKEEE